MMCGLGERLTQEEKERKLLNAKSPRLKERLSTEYSKNDIEEKRSCRSNKRHYIDTLATEAETAARNNDMRTLYKTTKKMRRGYRSQDKPVKTAIGTTVKGRRERKSTSGRSTSRQSSTGRYHCKSRHF